MFKVAILILSAVLVAQATTAPVAPTGGGWAKYTLWTDAACTVAASDSGYSWYNLSCVVSGSTSSIASCTSAGFISKSCTDTACSVGCTYSGYTTSNCTSVGGSNYVKLASCGGTPSAGSSYAVQVSFTDSTCGTYKGANLFKAGTCYSTGATTSVKYSCTGVAASAVTYTAAACGGTASNATAEVATCTSQTEWGCGFNAASSLVPVSALAMVIAFVVMLL